MAGGVALNCVANGKILRDGGFARLLVQPDAGDASRALGAALAVRHQEMCQPRETALQDAMQGSDLGPHYADQAVADELT